MIAVARGRESYFVWPLASRHPVDRRAGAMGGDGASERASCIVSRPDRLPEAIPDTPRPVLFESADTPEHAIRR